MKARSIWFARVGLRGLSIFPQVQRLFYLGKSAFWKLRVSAGDATRRTDPPIWRGRYGNQNQNWDPDSRDGGRQRKRGKKRAREDSCSPRCAEERCSCCFVQRIHQFHGGAYITEGNLREYSPQLVSTHRALIKHRFIGRNVKRVSKHSLIHWEPWNIWTESNPYDSAGLPLATIRLRLRNIEIIDFLFVIGIFLQRWKIHTYLLFVVAIKLYNYNLIWIYLYSFIKETLKFWRKNVTRMKPHQDRIEASRIHADTRFVSNVSRRTDGNEFSEILIYRSDSVIFGWCSPFQSNYMWYYRYWSIC